MVVGMMACVFEGKNTWKIKEVPKPEIRSDEVLVRVRAAGICGTDIHILKGEYFQDFPIVAGHEFSGEVVEMGQDVTQFRPG